MSNLQKKREEKAALFAKQMEEQKIEEEVAVEKEETSRTLPVIVRATKKIAVIHKNEYDATLHICI